MRREENKTTESIGTLLFYAPLKGDLDPTYVWDGNTGIFKNTDVSSSVNGAVLGNWSGLWFNCICPENINITFSCWIKKAGTYNINYSFGAATKNNAKYKGLQYTEYDSYWLICEYLYMCRVDSTYLTLRDIDVFCTWSIIYNGNKNYTFKFYKNGVLATSKTLTNSTWLGMKDSVFALAHAAGGSLPGVYHDFSCYELLDDDAIMKLYNKGGIAQ